MIMMIVRNEFCWGKKFPKRRKYIKDIEYYNNVILMDNVFNVTNNHINLLTKADYEEILKYRRKNFIHNHFKDVLEETFDELRKAALKGEKCSYTACFILEEHFDAENVKNKLDAYFIDLGYQTHSTISPVEPKEVVIVLN